MTTDRPIVDFDTIHVGDLRYCYRIQAWIKHGVVTACGHPKDGCDSCARSGEAHPINCADCH